MQGSCCPPGSWPALKVQYKPIGTVTALPDGQKMYHVGNGKRALVIMSDIFGAFNGRHQAIADNFAEWGYNVYLPQLLPEIYEGDVVPDKFMPYIKRQDQNKIKQTWKHVRAQLEKDGHKQFLLAGFCWGVWKAWSVAPEDDSTIAIVGFHPAIVVEKLLGGDEVELTKRQRCPSLLLPASNDAENLKPGAELIKIIKEKLGNKCESVEFPEMIHGWMTRGDLSDAKVKRDNQAALEKAKAFFDSFAL